MDCFRTGLVCAALAVGGVAGCAESELAVGGTTTDLPARADGQDAFHAFTVRNIGEGALTISSVAFADDSEGNFFAPDADIEELLAGDQAVIGFFYRTPDGAPQSATLAIESSATVNPTLEVELTTASAQPGGPDAGLLDAGGAADAGAPDAHVNVPDAGVDAGETLDGGAPDAT